VVQAAVLLAPKTLFHKIDKETFEWVWEHSQKLPLFYAKAGEQERAVSCTISHCHQAGRTSRYS